MYLGTDSMLAMENPYYRSLVTNIYSQDQLQAMVDSAPDEAIKATRQRLLNEAIAQFNIDNAAAPGANNPTVPPVPQTPPPAKLNTLLYVGIAAVVAYLAFKG